MKIGSQFAPFWNCWHQSSISEHYLDKYAQYSKPSFTLRLRDILIVEGSAARLDCKISGVPDPDIRWFKDHKEIEDGQHYSIEYEDDESCTLIIQEAFLVDAGTYTCQASNLLGRISCDAIVRVEREYYTMFLFCFLFVVCHIHFNKHSWHLP